MGKHDVIRVSFRKSEVDKCFLWKIWGLVKKKKKIKHFLRIAVVNESLLLESYMITCYLESVITEYYLRTLEIITISSKKAVAI